MGCSKSSSKREVYINTILPEEIRKISNKQSNLTPKGTRERQRSYDITYMWNLKSDTNELIYKIKTDSEQKQKNLWLPIT